MKNRTLLAKTLSACTLLALLASCAMISGNETPGQYVDDTTITSKVKAEILGDPNLKVLQINVETMQGVVQLSGFVDSRKSEKRAVDIARHVEGVTSVKDSLIIPMKRGK